jgi:hypothetical protein
MVGANRIEMWSRTQAARTDRSGTARRFRRGLDIARSAEHECGHHEEQHRDWSKWRSVIDCPDETGQT